MDSRNLSWLIRRHAIEMTHLSGGSHLGSILSVADIMGVLYAETLHVDCHDPKMKNRDRFILSKGHAGAAVYAALAECGFFPVDELKTHYQNGSRLSGHVSHYLPGIDLSTGSLGHGLSVGAGMALTAKLNHQKHKVYVVLGDGECDEGSVWEAVLFANHNRLNNLVAIVDHNRMQSMDDCEKTLELGDFAGKWKSFGWNVIEINGHSHDELRRAFHCSFDNDRPVVIIANTIKGAGVPFMENNIIWHYRFPRDGWQYDQAVAALHRIKPKDVVDPYTPDGIKNPQPFPEQDDSFEDRTTSATWKPSWIKHRGAQA